MDRKVPEPMDALLEELEEKGEHLQQHQLEGLAAMWDWQLERRGGIVADEMGLGKTCTTVVHLWRLRKTGKGGPYLVLCPLSVVNHWVKEISRFSCGALKPIACIGMQEERHAMLERKRKERMQPNEVLIVPYHLFTNDADLFLRFIDRCPPTHIVADEAHVMKNDKAQITLNVKQVDATFILLTGTPIQNNIGELYTLLSFCDNSRFPLEETKDFVETHKGDRKVNELKEILKKFSIRRKKELVCKALPPMEEVVFYHGLTTKQKQLYVNILIKNREAISTRPDLSLLSQVMHLRKAVSHPYLFPGQEPEPFTEGEHIVEASEKLRVLDSLLSYLRRNNHRVLLFSQFTSALDIIQDYLNYRNWTYERLDGSARAEERFASIQNFQKDKVDIFLLSTKAGGVGLTLTSADTVIFLDNDWNPQNDLQAMARCHRIGQEKPVRVIRLIARYTVEQLIHVRARSKLRLTDQLTEETSAKPLAADISRMLEHGLAKLKEDVIENDRLTDEQLERVIGETKDGRWLAVNKKAEEDEEKEKAVFLGDVDEAVGDDVDENDYFFFEGKRYRVDNRDKKAIDAVMGEQGKKPAKMLSRAEREAMERAREEARERRKESAVKAKAKKWEAAGYESLNVALPEEDSADENEEPANDGDEGAEMRFVTGDLTRPQARGAVVVVHAVDDSGTFGSGGIFTALASISPAIADAYESAGEMGDLARGDAHIIPVPGMSTSEEDDVMGNDEEEGDGTRKWSRYDVALVVAQRMRKRNELDLSSLAKGLRRVAAHARVHGASVHLARMAHGVTNVSWYAVEKTLKKELALHGIPVYVYYRPKAHGGTGAPAPGRRSREQKATSVWNRKKTRTPAVTVDDSDDEEEVEDRTEEAMKESSVWNRKRTWTPAVTDDDFIADDKEEVEDRTEEGGSMKDELKWLLENKRRMEKDDDENIKPSSSKKRSVLMRSRDDEFEDVRAKRAKSKPDSDDDEPVNRRVSKKKSPPMMTLDDDEMEDVTESGNERGNKHRSSRKKSPPMLTLDDNDDDDDDEIEDVTPVKRCKPLLPPPPVPVLGHIFVGAEFFLSTGACYLRRRILEQGGRVTVSHMDLYDVTHAVIAPEDREEEAIKLVITLLPLTTIMCGADFVADSIKAGRLL